jgi:hypothetical protein
LLQMKQTVIRVVYAQPRPEGKFPLNIETTETDLESTRQIVLHSLRRSLGLDRAVIFTILARGWTSLAGFMTLTLIAHFLTGAEQGYYYTFGSLVALQIVFELGFSFVILQMASHESAHLKLSPDGMISGSPVAHARLASVLQKAVKWYSIAAVLMFCTLVPTGIYFFNTHQQAGPAISWKLAWFSVVLAASFAFQIDPVFSFMEGCGYVPRVARTRLWQAVLGSTLAWTALLTHHGLFAPAMSITGQALVGAFWLWTQRKLLLGLLRHKAEAHRIKWRYEVWPFQWRIAVSWMCGYFIFQLFVPVLFAYRGPLTAGQMGMSLSIVNVLTSIAISWVNTKAAPFGSMIARKDYNTLDRTFFRALAQSLGVSIAFSVIAWSTLVVINAHHLKIASRMLPPLPFGILLLTMVVNHTVFSVAIYLRAHKQEKMLAQSVFGAVATMLSTYLLGKRFGAIGVVSGYFVLCVTGLGMALYTFQHYRRTWHTHV